MTAALLLSAVLTCGVVAGDQTRQRPPRPQPPPPPPAPTRDWIDVGGDVGLMALYMPRLEVIQLRPRVRGDVTLDPTTWLRLHADALVEGQLDDRQDFKVFEDYSARVREAWVQLAGNRADLRAGRGRLVWGRLDEVQPTDVINPIDIAGFLLDGRSEARRAVNFIRGRVYPVNGLSIEGVFVPHFEHGVFDELDEERSPFNLNNDLVLPANVSLSTTTIEEREPDVDWGSPLGGARVSVTLGRVDVSGSVYEGADGFGAVTFEPEIVVGPTVVGRLVETFSRFRMYGADFESVAGAWAFRGEMAYFAEKKLAGVSVPGLVDGRVLEAGAGFDRRVGGLRIYGLGLYHREWSDEDPGVEKSNLNLVGSVEQSFARDTHLLRAFGVVNPEDRSTFVRGVWLWSAADNVTLEVSGGAFLGTSNDNLGRFEGRDFAFARFRYRF
ncbi:MAG TPA: DUF1302 family protein [Vicinamibacterales bacterium]|nr:DUF1302 family protein [Vicinamibacterales bacterium]